MKKLFLKIWFIIFLLILPQISYSAVQFTASSSEYLSQADGLSTDISGANQSISFSWWMKLDSNSTDMGIVNKFDAGAIQRSYRCRYDTSSDTLRCLISGDCSDFEDIFPDSNDYDDGTFHNGLFVSNDIDIRVYKDGLLDSTPVSYTAGICDSSTQVFIGAQEQNDVAISFYDGVIDDVCIWDTALTATEALIIGTSKVKGICRQIQPANLKLYCALDECADGTNCSSDFICAPGSPMSPTNTPTGSAGEVLSYP